MRLVCRLDRCAEKSGRTYKWIASQLGVTQATVSRWVHSKGYPSVHTLFRIAALLECAVDELYEVVEE